MSFPYYSPVTVNTGQVPSSQTDFPMLINYTDARFKTKTNGGHVQNSSGFDIRPFSDTALTNALTFELERYNASTGEVVMWVKRSSIADGNITYIAYGDPTINTNGSDGVNTFSNNFLCVYHLKDGTTLNVSDSRGSNNGTNQGATAAAGQIDGAANFVAASNQYIDLGNVTVVPPQQITLSAWVNGTFSTSYNGVIVRNQTGDNAFLYVKSNGKLAAGCVVIPTTQKIYDGTGTHTLSTGTWYFVAMTYSNAAGLIGYVNAASDGTDTGGADLINQGVPTNIGRRPGLNDLFMDGTIDEARISKVARSNDWLTVEYNNQNAPSTFATLGPEVGGFAGIYRI